MNGAVAGNVDTTTYDFFAVRWPANGAAPTQLPVPSGMFYSKAFGMNEAGTVVGIAGDLPIRWPASGGYEVLAKPPHLFALPIAVNSSGETIGVAYDPANPVLMAVKWDAAGQFIDLPDLPGAPASYGKQIGDGGVAAGDEEGRATMWLPDNSAVELLPLPGGFQPRPFGVNTQGVVAGWWYAADGANRTTIWPCTGGDGPADSDGDTIPDTADNCPSIANTSQPDLDGDGVGDACDPDVDGDDVANVADNCSSVANTGQANFDGDGLGDACDPDDDKRRRTRRHGHFPSSNTAPKVVVGGIDTGVPNLPVGGGATMNDGVCVCATRSSNHGQYVSCVTQLTNDWRKAGLITKAQETTIDNAAAKNSIGK